MIKIRHLKIYCILAVSDAVRQRALKISFIVGTALNIINQGEILINLDINSINLIKIILTYLVPYSVTTYTATMIKLDFQIGTKANVDTDLICNYCKTKNYITKNEIIKECPKCTIHTKWRLN